MVIEETACLACEVRAGRIVPPGGTIYEDDLWVLDHSISPVLLRGWLILKPKRHVEHLADLSEAESAALGTLISNASAALMRALDAERVYACSFGELVRHVHWYLIPRYAEMPAHGIEVLKDMFAERSPWACSDAEAADAAASVRVALADPRSPTS